MKTREQSIIELQELIMHMPEQMQDEPLFADPSGENLFSAKTMLEEIEADTELGKQLLASYQQMDELF